MGTASSRNVVQAVVNVSAEASNSAIQDVAASARSFQGINVANVAGDVTIRRVTMDGRVEMSVAAYLEATQSSDVQQKVSQQLEQMAKASVSGINVGNSSRTSNETYTAINSVVRTTNLTTQSCNAEALSGQTINAAGIGGALTIEDVQMDAAVSAIVDCRMQAVQGNTSVQDLQQSVKQTAVSETVGLDLMAYVWLIIAGVVAFGVVVGFSMLIAYKQSGALASVLRLVLPVALLAGGAAGIMLLLASLDPVQPPPGVDREDNVLQYPFLDPAVVAQECQPAVFEGRTEFATPVTNAEQLAAWAKAYNARVDAHEARLAAAGAADAPAAAAPQMVAGAEEVGEGPGEDAPTDKRWPLIKVAHIDQRTGAVSCYAGEPPNHLRGWSQWGPTDAPIHPLAEQYGPNVYRPNPKFLDPTAVALLERLREGNALLQFLRCAEARTPIGKFSLTEEGAAACAAEVEAFHKLLKDSGAWERDGWEARQQRRFVPDSRFSLPGIRPQALWAMLTGLPHTQPLAEGQLDGAAPAGLTEDNMGEEARKVQVEQVIEGLDAAVLPLLWQLQAVRDAVGAEQGVSADVLAVWDNGFGRWKRELEKGWAHYDTGAVQDPASWRDVTLAFVSRLDRVTSLSPNPSSANPIFLNVWVWVGVVGGLALLFAISAFSFVGSSQRKGQQRDRFEAAKQEAQVEAIRSGNTDGAGGTVQRLRRMLLGGA
jgi:hypothetical protein